MINILEKQFDPTSLKLRWTSKLAKKIVNTEYEYN